MPDNISIGGGVIVGAEGWQARLAANKQAFLAAWVQRSAFQSRYAGLTNEQYVDALIATSPLAVSFSDRQTLVDHLYAGKSRAEVLGELIDNPTLVKGELNSAFVLMEYFGYLGRDPDPEGFNHWLGKLNQFGGNYIQAEMVKAFLSSSEYRRRFGQ